MWRSLLLGLVSLPLSAIAFFIGLAAQDFKTGVIAGFSVLALGLAGSVAILLSIRRLSTGDIFLPIPLAVAWSGLLAVLSIGTELVTAPACIGSAILFSACLWMVREGELPRAWAVVPAMIFVYEMLPVNIPGPFDDYFSFGGDAAYLLVQGIMYSIGDRRMLKP